MRVGSRLFGAFILLFINVLSIYARPAPDSSVKTRWVVRQIQIVRKISIRTPSLLRALDLKEGQVFSHINLDEVRRELLRRLDNLRFFYKAEVRVKAVSATQIDLELELYEKGTLFPLPVISYAQGVWTLGAGFVESNFFGTMNRLAMLAFWEDGNFNWAGYYAARDLFVRNFHLTSYLLYSKKITYEYAGTEQIKDYIKLLRGGTFDFVYWIHKRFRVTCRMDLIDYSFQGQGVLPRSHFGWLADFSLIYEGLDTREDYLVGMSLRLSWGRDVRFLGSGLDRVFFTWKLRAACNPGWQHNLVLTQLGAFSHGLEYGYFFEVGGRRNSYVPGIRGYKIDQFKAEHYVNSLLEYRIPFLRNGYFIYSFVPFVDHVLFKEVGAENSWRSFASYGLSVRVYLRKLLIPALILYGVYVEGNNEFSAGLSIGAQF